MTMLFSMIGEDVRLQVRSHFYAATFFMLAVICLAIFLIPYSPFPTKFTVLLVFADSAVMGLAFVGAFVLMEKGAGTLSALRVTPMPGSVYIASKIVSFTLLGVACGVVVAGFATAGAVNYLTLLGALIVANVFAILFGFALVTRTNSVNGFFSNLLIGSLILALPLATYLDFAPAPFGAALKVIPSYAMLVVIEAGLSPAQPVFVGEVIAVAYLMVWIAISWLWALRDYDLRLATGGL